MKAKAPAVFVCCPVMSLQKGVLIPALEDAKGNTPPLGVYLLLKNLEIAGYSCDVLDWGAMSELSFDEVSTKISSYQAAFFSANSMNWAVVRLLAESAKYMNPSLRTCIGGPHPTLYPESVRASSVFDVMFQGEADRWIILLYKTLLSKKESEIPGATFFTSRNCSKVNVVHEPDLNKLNGHVAYNRIPKERYHFLPVETSRGCKFNCTFCSIYSKNYWRSFSSERTVEKILQAEKYRDRFKEKTVSIVDNNFTTDHFRVINICKGLKEAGFTSKLSYDAAVVDILDSRLLEALKPFTSSVLIGAEVSTKKDAKKLKKPVTPSMIEQAAANLKAYGMSTKAVFSFIIGLPWHTVTDCLKTFSFAANLILNYGIRVYLQWYWAIPGSRIWQDLEKEGRININVVDKPGFFQQEPWFYSVRKIGPNDVNKVDKKIRPVQLCLSLQHMDSTQPPLEYSPPDLYHQKTDVIHTL